MEFKYYFGLLVTILSHLIFAAKDSPIYYKKLPARYRQFKKNGWLYYLNWLEEDFIHYPVVKSVVQLSLNFCVYIPSFVILVSAILQLYLGSITQDVFEAHFNGAIAAFSLFAAFKCNTYVVYGYIKRYRDINITHIFW